MNPWNETQDWWWNLSYFMVPPGSIYFMTWVTHVHSTIQNLYVILQQMIRDTDWYG